MAKQTTDGIDPDDPDALDAMADRLEAALDRIGRHLDTPRPVMVPPRIAGPRAATAAEELRTAELAARLDGLIARFLNARGLIRSD